MSYDKPLPVPDPESGPFWEGAKAHKLMLQRCASTGKHQFPPTTFCQGAGLERPEWVEASGRGRVFSWIVVRHPVPRDVVVYSVPQPMLTVLPPAPVGYRYQRLGGDIVLVHISDRLVVDVMLNVF